jgi:bacteriorhodopsin
MQVAAYGVLDVLAKVVFGFLVLVGAGPAVHEALNQERERWVSGRVG